MVAIFIFCGQTFCAKLSVIAMVRDFIGRCRSIFFILYYQNRDKPGLVPYNADILYFTCYLILIDDYRISKSWINDVFFRKTR